MWSGMSSVDIGNGQFLIGLGLLTVVPYGRELIRRRISSEPLLHFEILLVALLMDSGDGNLYVVTVPAVAWTCSVGSQVHLADRPSQTWGSATEYVQVSPLEIVVTWAHKPTPSL